MKKILFASILFSCFLIFGCKSEVTHVPKEIPSYEKEKNVAAQGPLAKKLYTNYHWKPTNIHQIEENELIDYAVTNNIDVTRSPSGLYYHVEKTNNSPNYKRGDQVVADYRGTFLNGEEFDSSYGRGEPIKFKVGQMNPSWNEGLTYMNQGSSGTLLVPSRLAYGEKGFPGYIDPNTPLIFTLECR